MVRPPAFADATSSTGFWRMVTVELLLMRVPLCAKRLMLRNNNAAKQPCYTRRRGRDPAETTSARRGHPPEAGAAATIDRKPRRVCKEGGKATRAPPFKVLAVGENNINRAENATDRGGARETEQPT